MALQVAPDPHDPLAPRPDEPGVGRLWWRARLYGRDRRRRRAQGPVLLALAMLLVGLAALAVVAIVRTW